MKIRDESSARMHCLDKRARGGLQDLDPFHIPLGKLAWSVILVAVILTGGLSPAAEGSVFYKFEIVAETGVGGFNSFLQNPTINDRGDVAFVGIMPGGESPFVARPSAFPVDVRGASPLEPLYSFGGPQINNAGKVVIPWANVNSWGQEIQVWDASNPGSMVTMARAYYTSDKFYEFAYFPSINDARVLEVTSIPGGNGNGVCDPGEVCVEQVTFPAKSYPSLAEVLATPSKLPHGSDFGTYSTLAMSWPLRPMLADTGQIVVRAGRSETDPIRLYSYDLSSSVDIAKAATGFTRLGAAPGISADGKIVVFIGDRGAGLGVFASIDDGSAQRKLVRIAGENASNPRPELGFSISAADRPHPLYFSTFQIAYRVAVTHLSRGRLGMVGDSFVVSFTATPNAPSLTNPYTNKPYTFTEKSGIWTVRVDIDAPLNGYCITPGIDDVLNSLPTSPNTWAFDQPDGSHSSGTLDVVRAADGDPCVSIPVGDDETNVHVRTPIPVIQIGDTVRSSNGSFVIDTLATHDQIAGAGHDGAGTERTARPGDHRVVFFASSGAKQFIVRASHLDSDQDGLLDHWEEEGIDSDQDGVTDLDLPAMGANVCKRDLFIEIDWLNDRPAGINTGHTNRPHPGVTQFIVDMFGNAPAPEGENPARPCAIPAGIEAHIDAGTGIDAAIELYSRNMLPYPGPYGGGDEIGQPGTGNHIDLLYRGLPNSVAVPGLETRSLYEIRRTHFGNWDKGAREFAFHYVIFADYQKMVPNNETPYTGQVTDISATSPSDTLVDINAPYDLVLEDNDVIVISGTGQGQVRHVTNVSTGALTWMRVAPDWIVPPAVGDKYVIMRHLGGSGAANFRQDFSPIGGNDAIMSLGTWGSTRTYGYLGDPIDQSHILAHEIGHNLGLRHGGNDHRTSRDAAGADAKPEYVSLMNYLYTVCEVPTRTPYADCPVTSYSGLPLPAPPSLGFQDWENLRMDFSPNDLSASSSAFAVGSAADPTCGYSLADRLAVAGPPDLEEPTIAIDAPASGAIISLGDPLKVRVRVTDNRGVASVSVAFDADGNGAIDTPADSQPALQVAPDTYEATFPSISGPTGSRQVRVKAEDVSKMVEVANWSVIIGTVFLGDINKDGTLDISDVILELRMALGLDAVKSCSDINDDGVVDISDVILTLRMALGLGPLRECAG